jgi:hypothetical protein
MRQFTVQSQGTQELQHEVQNGTGIQTNEKADGNADQCKTEWPWYMRQFTVPK